MQKIRLVIYLVCGLLLLSCGFNNSDRCPDGYMVKETANSTFCYLMVDGGHDVPEGDGGPDNFGDVCERDSDCEDGDATYCAVSGGPGGGREGVCTYLDCDSEGPECPSGYTCADCTQSGLPGFEVVVCLPDDMLESVVIQNSCDW